MSDPSFVELGFAVTEPLISHERCNSIIAKLEAKLENVSLANIDLRSLLKQPWCSELAIKLRTSPELSSYLQPDRVAVQCTYFEKSGDRNWLVPFHQDLSIPVSERIDHPQLRSWSVKEDTLFVQPPQEILAQITAVRLHLDESEFNDGSLKVIPSSHHAGILPPLKDRASIVCLVPKGGVLIMKPLLFHASSKSSVKNKRRVLHFLFAPPILPFGLKWKYCI